MHEGADRELVPEDTTPLDPGELAGLRLSWITTRADLNAAEGANIRSARAWAEGRALATDDILSSKWLRELHRRMFGDVWEWAGRYRTTEKNIGIPPFQITSAVKDALADCKVWLADQGQSRWSNDEVAIRLHHRLVWIHPFPNGNGRVSRLCADLVLHALRSPLFTWGSGSILEPGDVRRNYISALELADQGEFEMLLAFARS